MSAETFEPREPFVRWIAGEPFVILTKPARRAVCIAPDGSLVVRSLLGVRAGRPLDQFRKPLSREQWNTLNGWNDRSSLVHGYPT